MTITDLIEQLEELEAQHGDLDVELDNCTLVSIVDAVYTDGNYGAKPVAVVIK
tara:strand:- start:31413 stop:31571 length:159 start_codon:yes stop_codon:yes gene_type:complete